MHVMKLVQVRVFVLQCWEFQGTSLSAHGALSVGQCEPGAGSCRRCAEDMFLTCFWLAVLFQTQSWFLAVEYGLKDRQLSTQEVLWELKRIRQSVANSDLRKNLGIHFMPLRGPSCLGSLLGRRCRQFLSLDGPGCMDLHVWSRVCWYH